MRSILEQMITAESVALSHLQTGGWYRDLTAFQEQRCVCRMG